MGSECELGDYVPGWPVLCATKFDQPTDGILRKLRDIGSLDDYSMPSWGDNFLLLEPVKVDPEWRGLAWSGW